MNFLNELRNEVRSWDANTYRNFFTHTLPKSVQTVNKKGVDFLNKSIPDMSKTCTYIIHAIPVACALSYIPYGDLLAGAGAVVIYNMPELLDKQTIVHTINIIGVAYLLTARDHLSLWSLDTMLVKAGLAATYLAVASSNQHKASISEPQVHKEELESDPALIEPQLRIRTGSGSSKKLE